MRLVAAPLEHPQKKHSKLEPIIGPDLIQHTPSRPVWIVLIGVWAMVATPSGGAGSTEPKVDSQTSTPRETADWLSEKEAIRRAERVGDIHYRIDLDLTGKEVFEGSVRIDFDYRPGRAPLTLDFSQGNVESLIINDHRREADYNGYFLSIDPTLLKSGANTVEIRFEHPYSDDGTGLYRFEDPVDSRSYVYSYLWPYYANRVFPCFDQPDLKARFQISVKAPADWTVVSTTRENQIETRTGDGTSQIWQFPESAPLSTYIYSLHAGPYRMWESKAGKIPLRLFARQSLAEAVDVDAWFTYTRQGLAFYQRYFDIPYPFGKYDQLIVPDFNIGAMENAAAVTFTEGYVWRGEATQSQRESLAGVILHEMAHMWFGDLVTKKWWNGLWLNESFATLMATMAKVEATEFEDAWHSFYLHSKRSAYHADGLVTTHPIEVPVNNTADFFEVFDAITYGKGASVLKQLSYSVGEADFRDGVRKYLKQHAYSNTRLEDFIRAIGEASGQSLDEWSRQWLDTAGFDTVAARTECAAGELSRLEVWQTGPGALPTVRAHRAELALYSVDEHNGVELDGVVPLRLTGDSIDLTSAVGKPCPDIVFPNHDDWGYFRIRLDAQSLTALERSLSQIDDALARSMMWGSLWDMVNSGELELTRFAGVILDLLGTETDVRVVAQVLDYLDSTLDFMHRRQPESRSVVRVYGPRIEEFLWAGTQRALAGSDLQKVWFDHFVSAAHTESVLKRLAELLDSKEKIQGLEIDQDRRWEVLVQLASWNHESVPRLTDREKDRDASYSGKLWAIAVEAVRPDLVTKQAWLDEFQKTTESMPFGQQRQAMSSLFPAHQTEIQNSLLGEVLAPIPEMSRSRDAYFLSSYGYGLLRNTCSQSAVDQISKLLEQRDQLASPIERALLETRQEAERCVRLDLGN